MPIPPLINQLATLNSVGSIIMAVHQRNMDGSLRRIAEFLREIERMDRAAQSSYGDMAATLIRLHLFGVHETVFQTFLIGEMGDVSALGMASQIGLVNWLQGMQSNKSRWAYFDELRKSAVRRRTQVKQIVNVLGGVSSLCRDGLLFGDANLSSLCHAYRALKSLSLPSTARFRAVKILAGGISHVLPKFTATIPSSEVVTAIEILADAVTQPLDDNLTAMFAWDKGAMELAIYPTNKVSFDPVAALTSFRLGLQHAPFDKRGSFEENVARALYEVAEADASKVDETIEALSSMRASLDVDSLFLLGKLVTDRYNRSRDPLDETLSIEIWKQAIAATSSDSARAEAQVNLATVLELAATDEQGGLQSAIILRRKALPFLQDSFSQTWARVAAARGLLARYELHRSEQDLDELQTLLREAFTSDVIDAGPQIALDLLKTYSRSINLGLTGLFDQSEHADEIARSLLSSQSLPDVDLVMVHTIRQWVAYAVWQRNGRTTDLETALQHGTAALELAKTQILLPLGISRSALLQARAICYLGKYHLWGHLADLRHAQDDLQNAISLSNDLALISSQAIAVSSGHVNGHTSDDAVDNAIKQLEQIATQGGNVDSLEWVQWSLGNLLIRSYCTRGIVGHLHKGIANLRAATQVLRLLEHPQLALSMAQALYHLFMAENQIELLNEAITLSEDALEHIPASDPDRWNALVTLANAFQERFLALSNDADSMRAAELLQEALLALAPDSVSRNAVAGTLVGVLIEQGQAGIGADSLGRAASLARDLASTTTEVFSLDPQIASNIAVVHLLTSSSEQETETWLSVLERLSRNQPDLAAALRAAQNWMHQAYGAERWHDVENAYERICTIRQRVMSFNNQFVHLETVLRRFQHSGAIAALSLVNEGKYKQAAHLLDDSQATLLRGTGATREEYGHEKIWDHVDQVWYITSTRYGGFAIAVSARETNGILLPALTSERQKSWRNKPFESLTDMGETTLKPLVDASGIPERLVLIPIGSLSSLPWAAARIAGKALLDWSALRVLPSLNFSRSPPDATGGLSVLVEVMHAPAHAPLNHVNAEVTQIGAWLPDHHVLRGDEATEAAVIKALSEASLVHFACHGLADATHPARSALLLGKGNALSVALIAQLNSSKGNFAFLSACETATGGDAVPDEFANIAAAFLAARFKASIGSLTKVNDVAASILARRFYWHFLVERLGAAQSLRRAQMWIRDVTAADVCLWLDTLAPAATPTEAGLRKNLRDTGAQRIFALPRYWSTYVYYGL